MRHIRKGEGETERVCASSGLPALKRVKYNFRAKRCTARLSQFITGGDGGCDDDDDDDDVP